MVKSKINDLRKLLADSLADRDVELLDERYSLLTAPGEHYGSVMLALDVRIRRGDGRVESLDLVAKLLPANEMLRTAFDIYVTFKKEVHAYSIAIPALVAFQKEYGIPKEKYVDHLFPKCYGARVSLDENSNRVDEDGVLIFENLKIQGYRTIDRLVGFDYPGAKIVVRDLARVHATNVALKTLQPETFESKILPCLVKNKGLETLPEEVGRSFHEAIMDTAKQIPELQPYLGRLQKVVDYFAVHPFVERPPPGEPWGTFTHCDYWTSNTMLLVDSDGKPLKNKMVDLQLLRYTSAQRDLIFFLFTSVINKVLDQHYDELIKTYYDSFIETLKDYNLDLGQFSWESFQKEYQTVGKNETYHVLVMLKPICTEKDKVTNSAEDFVDTDWSRRDLLGPHHKQKLKDTVLAFARLGFI